MARQGYRGQLFSFVDNPAGTDNPSTYEFYPDGLLVIEDGHILSAGAFDHVAPRYPDLEPLHLPDQLITPGFIDAHVHYPQTDMIGAFGTDLMDWLTRHTFPAELEFADRAYAEGIAEIFLDELLRNGTTSALVLATVHAHTVDVLMEAALERNLRLICGKVLMDRSAPKGLCDPLGGGIEETDHLIKTWALRGRLGYAITPRFALTSSPEQLAQAGALLARHDSVLLHTHLSESTGELAEVARLFPEASDYLNVYERFGLVGPRSVFAHCIHMGQTGHARIAQAGAAEVHCPTSNFFLGSGLYDLAGAQSAGATIALGTDVGAGTSFSQLRTMAQAYEVAQLRGAHLSALDAFYMATLGAAKALHIDDKVGRLAPGYEADFLVIDPSATPLLARRTRARTSITDLLFPLMILGDDRCIARTYVAGALAHKRNPS